MNVANLIQMKVWDAHRFTPENNTPIWNVENKVNANHTQNLQVSPENLHHRKKLWKTNNSKIKIKSTKILVTVYL